MGCTQPLIGIPDGLTVNGKQNYKILTSDGMKHLEDIRKYMPDGVLIPCGKCPSCRMNTARQWADRCFLEMQDHEENWFITLSYDDEHLPRCSHVDDRTGEYHEHATLKKEDWQKFMKRLRRNSGQELKFLCSGEYGDHTLRPHYHAIIFGLHLPLDDLSFYKKNELGQPMYNSKLLQKCWTDKQGKDKGFIVAAPATYETIAYTCRYVLKKAYGKEKIVYESFGLVPPFLLMSRRKAIGRNWYDEHKEELFEHRCVYIPKLDGSQQIIPGRYFRNLYEVDNPEESAILKEKNRWLSEKGTELKLSQSDLSWMEQLGVEESEVTAKLHGLPRATF